MCDVKKRLSIILISILFSCTPGVFQYMGKPEADPEIIPPAVESFTSENTIYIQWEADVNADEYILYRAPDTDAANPVIVYQGNLLEYSDVDCVPEVRYLYSLSKIRGWEEFGPSAQTPGVCSSIMRDFYEPNDTKDTAAWLEYDMEANLYFYRDTLGNIIEDADWYYVEVPPRRIANIVVSQNGLAIPDTYMYFYQEGEIPFQIINNTDIPIENLAYTVKKLYFKIYPIPDEFIADINQAGGTIIGYQLSLHMITSL